MAASHTVEKIGGTSMTRFGELLETVIIGRNRQYSLKNRIFVVSAYSGITNLLLEHKKTGQDGVYQLFRKNDPNWKAALDAVLHEMQSINKGLSDLGLPVSTCDEHIAERVKGIKSCLNDLRRLCSYGHFQFEEFLPAIRELLASIGEYHSAYNSVEILNARSIKADLADLSGWKSNESLTLDDKIRSVFSSIDIANTLTIATGYTKCREGLMQTFDRGYSEITFSKIATVTKAAEGIIHKEFHLSSGDPNIIGIDKVTVIGEMNFDMADQLADLGMEAIHPKAGKGMEMMGIPIRVKNAFDPDHPGTLITTNYVPTEPKVSMICGRNDLAALEINDPEMVGQFGYDYQIVSHLNANKVSYIAKNTNANTITHYLAEKEHKIGELFQDLKIAFPKARIRIVPVGLVSVVGSHLTRGGVLAKTSAALADAGIEIQAVNQCMRQVNLQVVINREDFNTTLITLHNALI